MHIYRLERSISGTLMLKKGLETYMFKGAKGDFRMGHILHSEEFFIERALADEQIIDNVVFEPHRSVRGMKIALRSKDDKTRVFFDENTIAFTEDMFENKCSSIGTKRCFSCKSESIFEHEYQQSKLLQKVKKLTWSSYIDLDVGDKILFGSLLVPNMSRCHRQKPLVHTYKVSCTEYGLAIIQLIDYDDSAVLL